MSPVHVTTVLAGVVVVLHSFLPADVAAFSVGISFAYSIAFTFDDDSNKDGMTIEEERKLRLVFALMIVESESDAKADLFSFI
jgi:putative flippase GtrA